MREYQAVGLGGHEGEFLTENNYRHEKWANRTHPKLDQGHDEE